MITGNIKSQIDQIWNAFWSGGISTPLKVIEQITYLLFLRRLDDLHTLEEKKSARLKRRMARRVFPKGNDGIGEDKGRPYEDLRWAQFKHFAPGDMCVVLLGCSDGRNKTCIQRQVKLLEPIGRMTPGIAAAELDADVVRRGG